MEGREVEGRIRTERGGKGGRGRGKRREEGRKGGEGRGGREREGEEEGGREGGRDRGREVGKVTGRNRSRTRQQQCRKTGHCKMYTRMCMFPHLYNHMRISTNHNSLGCKQSAGLDVNQSLIAQYMHSPATPVQLMRPGIG